MSKKFKNFVKIIAVFTMCLALLLPFAGCEELSDLLHTHTFRGVMLVERTCGQDGKEQRICDDCGYTETEILPATGNHTYSEWETTEESDCVHTGHKERTCSVCGNIDTQEIPKMSADGTHSYGEWSITDDTYCGHDGEKERVCSVCGDTETEVIPATGEHKYGEWETTKDNDCGHDGEKERTCSECGDKETEIIPATGEHQFDDNGICSVCGQLDGSNDELGSGDEAGAKSSDLSIHFLELGNKATGDSILIKCGNTEVLIDAGSQQGSSATLKSYIDKYCTDGKLEYVIATHADTDHISAFVGTSSGGKYNGILYSYEIGTLIHFAITGKDTQIYQKFCDAVSYAESKGTQVFTAKQCYEQTDGAQRQYYIDSEQKVSLNILYNYYYYNKSSDENNHSVVTLLTEELANGNRRNYLFTGDLEEEGESKLVDYYKSVPAGYQSEYNVLPEVDLYKAGHHGSKTSSTAKLLAVIKPKYVAVCCCCGSPEYTKANDNTFPTQVMIDNVGKYTDKIYVTTLATNLPAKDANGNYTSQSGYGFTSMNGNIVFYSKNGKLNLWCSNNDTILKDTEWFKENRVWHGV